MASFETEQGQTIHYETFGEHGDWIVFLNGMTQSTAHWKSHARHFAKSHRVLLYDAQGQGASTISDHAPSLLEHASDLEALLREVGAENATLVGFSHGCRIALKYAVSFGRCSKLMLCSATATPTVLAKTIVESWRRVLASGGIEAMTWAAIPDILGNGYLTQNEKLIPGMVKASVQRNNPKGVKLLLEGMSAYPSLDGLAEQVNVPTFVLAADRDPLVEPEGARKLAELCGGGFALIEGAGHTLPIEKPAEFRRHVESFILS